MQRGLIKHHLLLFDTVPHWLNISISFRQIAREVPVKGQCAVAANTVRRKGLGRGLGCNEGWLVHGDGSGSSPVPTEWHTTRWSRRRRPLENWIYRTFGVSFC